MTSANDRSQSAISEVRDQLCLDEADGKYLNNVSANLGLQRPPFGFTDDTWRALVKAIALQYKQIRTKFEEVLTILLGPKVTQCGALAQNALVGDRIAVLVDTTQFPQVGIMVLDEGQVTEETVEYGYIDRYTNTVYFVTPLVHGHVAVAQQWETAVVSPASIGGTSLTVFDPNGLPTVGLPISLNIGRGTVDEETVLLNTVDLTARKLTVSALTKEATSPSTHLGNVVTAYSLDSQINAHFLTLVDVSTLPLEGGYLQIPLGNSYTATGGSSTTVTVVGALDLHAYGGMWVRFVGNVTATLTNVIGYVLDNTGTVITFSNTLPASPAAGDSFTVLANIQYLRANQDDESVLMHTVFPNFQQVRAGAEITVLSPTNTVSIAQVQVKGVGWDVFQSSDGTVEILLPEGHLINDLRSASYIRETGLSGTATADMSKPIGATEISVTTTSGMPVIGVLSAAGPKQYAYYNPSCTLTVDAFAGDTTIFVTDTSQFDSTGNLNVDGSVVTYTVVDATSFSVSALPSDVLLGASVRDENILKLTKGLIIPVTSLDTITFYTNYDSGDVWNVPDTWPGPYVWDFFAETHKKETNPNNHLTANVAGPTVLDVDKVAGAAVLEVTDASVFSTAVPYDIILGENSGNVETVAVQQVSLKSRTYTTTGANINPGDLSVQVTALGGPTTPLNLFPNAGPYRVLVDPFGTPEVLEVASTATGPNRLILDQAALGTHTSGVRVVLLSDLLRISPALADDHMGKISFVNRFNIYGAETQDPDLARPFYTTVTLSLSGSDFELSNGDGVFNFGDSLNVTRTKLVSISGSNITVDDSSGFPTTHYPYTIHLDAGAGPLLEEVLHVTNNNTGTNVFTVSHPPVFSHVAGRAVEFQPGPEENFSYTTRTGSVLSFTPYLLIENTHFSCETVAATVGTGFPRTTGFDFPLRTPISLIDRIQFATDLVRAAGVHVLFISHR